MPGGMKHAAAVGCDMNNREFLEREIMFWKGSPERRMQIKGQFYYIGEHDILTRKRTMIGEDGRICEIDNLPNNIQIDNQYAKMVNQKVNYLLGQPFVIETENKTYASLLKEILDSRFKRTLKSAGKAAYNHGICWLYPYYRKDGEFLFRLLPGYEVHPIWADGDHTVLEGAIRLYTVTRYEGAAMVPDIVEKVEVFDSSGIRCYELEGNTLIPDPDAEEVDCSYVMCGDDPYNWSRIPLIPVRANEQEIPLIKKTKCLQDGINMMLSDFENAMQEDSRNTILVLKNYDGTNLGEFRRNLAQFGAVKVRSTNGGEGGIETLEMQVDSDNYKSILDLFKKALTENAMGYDAKDDRLSGNPNQMNIQSMYSDIDLDANEFETELQAAFKEILWFINAHLTNTGKGDFFGEDVSIIFNRDILINETEAIQNCQASTGILSDRTVISQHPWIDDVDKEIERIKEQETQYDPFQAMIREAEDSDVDETR